MVLVEYQRLISINHASTSPLDWGFVSSSTQQPIEQTNMFKKRKQKKAEADLMALTLAYYAKRDANLKRSGFDSVWAWKLWSMKS